jgi:hypothetical protein
MDAQVEPAHDVFGYFVIPGHEPRKRRHQPGIYVRSISGFRVRFGLRPHAPE